MRSHSGAWNRIESSSAQSEITKVHCIGLTTDDRD
jgi:hypothetical protein